MLCQFGSSSPGRGGSPPVRVRKRIADTLSPIPLRSAKKSSAVRIAVSFSAAAITKNWFMLVPSAAASLSIAAFRESGSRREKVATFVVIFVPSLALLLVLTPQFRIGLEFPHNPYG